MWPVGFGDEPKTCAAAGAGSAPSGLAKRRPTGTETECLFRWQGVLAAVVRRYMRLRTPATSTTHILIT